MLATTLAVPATAAANPWASITPMSMCAVDTLPAATTAVDTTTVPAALASGWFNAPVNVTLSGTGMQGNEWNIDCAGLQTGPTAQLTGTGTHSFIHRVQETGTGNSTPWVEEIVQVDTTVPVDTSNIPSGWQNNAASVTLTGTDATGTSDQSGVAWVHYELDGGPVQTVAPGYVLNITQDGTHNLRTRVEDNAGNLSAPRTSTVQVDSAGPVDTTTVPVGWVTTPYVDITVQGTDAGGSGVAQLDWQLDAGTVHNVVGAGPVTARVSGDGVHTLSTRITDGNGQDSGWKAQTVRIDTVLPADTTSVSSAWLSRTSLDVTVHGTDATSGVARVEHKIDGATAVSTSGDTATAPVTGTGEHTVETQIIDNAGLVSGWKTHAVRLDPTNPVNTTPTTTNAWRQNAYSVRLDGSDELSGIARVEWRVDNGTITSGALGVTSAYVSGDGTHTLSTRLVDVAGNASVWRDETVRIDSVKPVDTTTVPATVPGGRKITLTGTDALSGLSGSVEWQLDSGPVKTSSQATILGAGPHVLKTRVQDNAGNWSDWKSSNVTVDGSLPLEDSDPPVDTTSILGIWNLGPESVTVSAEDDGTGVKNVQYRIDGQAAVVVAGKTTTFTVSDDGDHTIQTRAVDNAGNTSAWRTHTLRIDQTLPVDTSTLSADWVKSRDVELKATDATSGVASIDYQVNSLPVVNVLADHVTFTLPGDGTFTVRHRVTDVAGQQTGWTTSTIKVDTVIPVNTSAAAPITWQTVALSLPLSGTDAGSGVDHAEYRVAGGDVKTGTPAVVGSEGTQTLETRIVDKAGNASLWRSETIKVDVTKPVNTTPAVTQQWRNSNFATTVSGTDAASGVAKVEWKLDTGSVSVSPAVSIAQEGNYKLYTRVTDVAGNDSGWRTDLVGIDKTAPTLAADCGPATWRNTPAACRVAADGGLSGLKTLTAARGGEGPVEVTGGSHVVEAEGSSTVTFRAADGAGNEVSGQSSVKIDRTPPAATVACVPDAKSLNYVCTAGGSDGLSGLVGLAWSRDGGAATPIAVGGTFTVAKGKIVVSGKDTAGNVGTSAPATLAERHKDEHEEGVTPRSTSEAVLLGGKATSSRRLVGQLSLAATPTATTVDLRPLALGKGTFQLVIKITVGKKSKTISKTQTTVKGYSKRITVKGAAGANVKVQLTVKRKSGKRWVKHATASAHL